MAGSTIADLAASQVSDGNADFEVIAAHNGPEMSHWRIYVITLPMSISRGGPRYVRSTKFGLDLHEAFRKLSGVNMLTSDSGNYTLTIEVASTVADEPMPGFRYRSKGLPANVAVTIQEVILRNRGPIQRLAEAIRRNV